MARKRDDTVKLVLRLPPELHRRLKSAAARKNRSLNSEMLYWLDVAFRLPDILDTKARMKSIALMMEVIKKNAPLLSPNVRMLLMEAALKESELEKKLLEDKPVAPLPDLPVEDKSK